MKCGFCLHTWFSMQECTPLVSHVPRGVRGVQLTGVFRDNGLDESIDLEAAPLLGSSSSHKGVLENLEVNVIGMTCVACSGSVEKALLKVDGVFRASVALLQNKAEVTYDPSRVKEEDIKEAIEDIGFEAEIIPKVSTQSKDQGTMTGQFRIGGMTCAACVNSVEGILRNLPGVTRAVVALATSLGEVEYDSNQINKTEIITAIEDAGFEAKLNLEKKERYFYTFLLLLYLHLLRNRTAFSLL
ncbi:hypothetical protein KI387_035189 [Taxus chinensis]|uniref:HMA domain-containing protein n=1 Tax=Taxus chinensis TaxID=29808 RepID=A0AA38KIZ1_TAXCH|nr:hypothetical protein KI387_035189 [Taxus chinensis]